MQWHNEKGELISCHEKIKVHEENLEELQNVLQDIFEDAILMEFSKDQLKKYLHKLIEELKDPFTQ